MRRGGLRSAEISLLAFLVAMGPAGNGAAESIETPCTVIATSAGAMTHLELTDLEVQFPEFKTKADKGVTVTLEHLVQVKIRDGFLVDYHFGCKVTYDLWKNTYRVVPTGSSAARALELLPNIKILPLACRTLLVPYERGILKTKSKHTTYNEIQVLTKLDPVSEEQAEKTRKWLAERGIGAAAPALLGRAVAALIDLKEDKAVTRRCRLNLIP